MGRKHKSVQIGQMYGRLVPIEKAIVNNRPGYICQCSCGNITKVRGYKLLSGHTQSCGCLRKEITIARNTTGITPIERAYDTIKKGAITRQIEYDNPTKYDFQLSIQQVEQLITKPCHYCGRVATNTTKTAAGILKHNGIDRMNNDIGYIEGNVVTACKHCNRLKGELSYWEFVRLVYDIVNHMEATTFRNPETEENV